MSDFGACLAFCLIAIAVSFMVRDPATLDAVLTFMGAH